MHGYSVKFWQKIFLGTFILFVIIFDIGVYYIVSYSYDTSLERETDSAIREEGVILSSITTSIINAERLTIGAAQNAENLLAIVAPLASYYEPQGIKLALYLNDEIVYSTISEADEKQYLKLESQIPKYEHLKLVYARNITQLNSYKEDIGSIFVVLNAVVFVTLGIALYILLNILTKPIKMLNKATAEISSGAYDKRVKIKSKDEVGDLSSSFNQMADSIQDKIEQLIEASEVKQQFIDNLSHEMRTPLTSIIGYSEYLQQAMHDEEQRITAAGHLHDSAVRLQNLHNKLMELIIFEQNKIQITEVSISKLVDATKSMMLTRLEDKKITLHADISKDIILADETLLLAMVTNLIENAIRASEENQEIRLRVYEDQYPIIEVCDDGCGMEEKEIDKITEPFYRIDKSRSQASGGVGLGLTLCKKIVTLHHATMIIKSNIGKGTTIQIVFNNLITNR